MLLQNKPQGVKRKIVAMYQGKFYLAPHLRQELLSMIECGLIPTDRYAVEFIDRNGEWFK